MADLQTRDGRWWRAPTDVRAKIISDVAQSIYRDLAPLRQDFFFFAGLYEAVPFMGPGPNMYKRRIMPSAVPRLSWNGVKAVTDTYVALVTETWPMVKAITSGGSWDLQRRAKALTKFIGGSFYQAHLYPKITELAYDDGKFGTGILEAFVEKGADGKHRLKFDRVLPWELLVADEDAFYGEPKSYYRLRWIDREVAKAKYPRLAAELDKAGNTFSDAQPWDTTATYFTSYTDRIPILEAYHLPCLPGADDGRKCVVSGSLLLEDEEYSLPVSPFFSLYRQRPTVGYWGQSLCKELASQQMALNRTLRDVHNAIRLMPGHWMIENNSKVNTNSINDLIGWGIRYTGTQPTYYAPPPVADQVFAYMNTVWQRMFETIGVNQQTAQAQIPPGITASVAIETYATIQSKRFLPSYRELERFILELARYVVSLGREYPDLETISAGRGSSDVVRWADASLEEEAFDLKLFDVNVLSEDPTERIQQVQDLMGEGVVDPETGRRLLAMPDLEEENSLVLASYNLVLRTAEQMIDTGDYEPPEPFMQLSDSPLGGPGGIKLVQQVYLKAKLEGVPEARLDLLRRWIAAAQALITPPPAPPAPPPPRPVAPPAAPAGPMPQGLPQPV